MYLPRYHIEYDFRNPHGRIVFDDGVDMKKEPTEQEIDRKKFADRVLREIDKFVSIYELVRRDERITKFATFSDKQQIALEIYKELNRK